MVVGFQRQGASKVERERACARECVCVCKRERVSVCVRERETERPRASFLMSEVPL